MIISSLMKKTLLGWFCCCSAIFVLTQNQLTGWNYQTVLNFTRHDVFQVQNKTEIPSLTNIITVSGPQKYVTVECNMGRLGNQLWILFSGWSIGQALNRRLYLNCGQQSMQLMTLIKTIFPKVGNIFDVMRTANETKVQFDYTKNLTWGYEDPTVFANRTEKFLRINISFGRNPRFIYPYRGKIHEILEFQNQFARKGDTLIAQLKSNIDNVLCVHVRRDDFVQNGWMRTSEDTFAGVRYVTRIKPNHTLFLMGDDRKFMKNMVDLLIQSGDVAKDSFHSTFYKMMDMYLSSRICKTLVLTSEVSTFSFWLGFLAGERSDIYYLKENRPNVPQFDSKFPFPWKAIKVVNGTVIQ